MTAFSIALAAMVDAGVTSIVAEKLLSDVVSEAQRPLSKTERNRRWRAKKRDEIVPRDKIVPLRTKKSHIEKNSNDFNGHGGTKKSSSLRILSKNLERKEREEVRIQEVVIPPAVGQESFGYVSFDETVNFTAAEIAKLSLDCYSLTNVSGQIRNLAESKWMTTMKPVERKRAIINKIKKTHNSRLEIKQPLPQERLQSERELMWETQRRNDEKNAKADATRKRLGYG